MITSFINKTEEELGMWAYFFYHCRPSDSFLDSVKRQPPSSLSTADINLLQIWFDALCESRGKVHRIFDDVSTKPIVVRLR